MKSNQVEQAIDIVARTDRPRTFAARRPRSLDLAPRTGGNLPCGLQVRQHLGETFGRPGWPRRSRLASWSPPFVARTEP